MPTIELQIFSPRWGHDDTYEIELERDHMEIARGANTARADWRDNADPAWSGWTVEGMMGNDSIHPPAVAQRMVPEGLDGLAKWRDRRCTSRSGATGAC